MPNSTLEHKQDFHTLTDADWERAFIRARSETNEIMEKIRAKLGIKETSENLTPDKDSKVV